MRPSRTHEPPLVGTTFVLRPFRVEDFDAAHELGQDPATAPWMPPLPAADGAGVVEYFEDCRNDGGLLDLVIADLRGDCYLGEVVVAVGEHRVGELGCSLVPAARGRGVATEAMNLSPVGPSARSASAASRCSSRRRTPPRCASWTGPAFATRGCSATTGTPAARGSTSSSSRGFRPTCTRDGVGTSSPGGHADPSPNRRPRMAAVVRSRVLDDRGGETAGWLGARRA